MKNRKNNKGFSLVELIVVVAIMAVLVGVLAPAYLKYVENSRVSKDVANVDEAVRAVEVALSDETIFDDITFDATNAPIIITYADETAIDVDGGTCAKLTAELKATLGTDTLDFVSKTHNDKDLVITIANDLKVSHTFQ